MMKKTMLLFFSMVFIASVCFGQTSTTGAINGTVTDPDGITLPGITVTLKSPALVLPQLTTVTNVSGVYRFPLLGPGTYELTFMLEGMNTLVRKGIEVSLGKTATVDVGMTLRSIEESIVVSGKAPTIDRQSTVGAANLNVEFLEAIPAVRNFAQFFWMTPGVEVDDGTLSGGSGVHGSAETDNAYLLDGQNIGDFTTGTTSGGFGMDIMEEISVQTGGLTAEYGSVKGAVINVVTKSGGNKFSGTASFYLDHEKLQSDNRKGTDLEPEEGEVEDKTGRKFKYEPVLTLGGPLIKDKLWFFGNMSMMTSESYIPGYPWDKAEGDPDTMSDDKRWYPHLKLTFQPNQSDKFVVSYNYSSLTRNHRFADAFETESSTAIQTSPRHLFNFHWTKSFGSNLYANLKFAFYLYQLNFTAKQPGPGIYQYSSGLAEGSSWRNQDNNGRDRYQVNFDATTFIDDLAGSHELKFGGEMQLGKSHWEVVTYSDPINGSGYSVRAPLYFGEPGWYYGINFNGGFDRKETMLNYSFFVNDTWSITKNLTLNIGVRYDYNSMIWPVQGMEQASIWNPFGEPVDKSMPNKQTPMKWNNFAARLGLIYDVFSDGTTLFKTSYGRYIQPNQTGWINTAHPNGWFAYQVMLNNDTGEPTGVYLPFWSPGEEIGIGIPDRDIALNAPYMDELTIGLERELWEDWSFGIRYIKKWDKNLIEDVDANRLDLDALLDNGELVWIGWEEVPYVDTYSGDNLIFYNELDPGTPQEMYIINPPGAERKYDGVEITLNKRYSNGWQINASYVWQDSRGIVTTTRNSEGLGGSALYENPNYHINNYGQLEMQRNHSVKINAIVKGPWGINLGTFTRWLSGKKFTRTVNNNYEGVSLNQTGETNFAEKRGTSGAYPARFLVDLRLEKEFKISNFSLKIFADIFNVFNENFVIDYLTHNGNHPNYEYLEHQDLVDPRIVRLGAKIEF